MRTRLVALTTALLATAAFIVSPAANASAANTARQSVNTTLITLAADIKSSGSFSEADGETILSDVQASGGPS